MPAPTAEFPKAVALLERHGATEMTHPGGTLLAHLQRVQDRLAQWGARPALQLAGLCHAFYGTDGFPAALLPLESRGELTAAIGTEAEALVYLYASCDREATYPALRDAHAPFHDRFTGREFTPAPAQLRDFAELSAANELDLARIDPAFREKWSAELLALFTRFHPLLSQPAWSDCQSVLAAGSAPGD